MTNTPDQCGACGATLDVRRERRVAPPYDTRHMRRIVEYRCPGCRRGGARTYDLKTGELCFTSGPVFRPTDYKRQIEAREPSRDPTPALDGPQHAEPAGWQVVADD